MELLISIKKVSISVLFTFSNMITLSFVTKKKSFFFLLPTEQLLEIDCSHLKLYRYLHQKSQLPALRTWVCSIMILLEAVPHFNAANIEPPFGNLAHPVEHRHASRHH